MRELETRAQEIKDRKRPLMDKLNQRSGQIKQAEQRLTNMDSQTGRQEAKLENLSQDSLKAYRWLLENQDRFEKEVFGPPIVCCSVKDPKYADVVESLFQRTDFIVFTTQSKEDFRTLQKALNTELRLSDVAIRTCSVPLERFQPPMSEQELKALGFQGWAKDFLSGPEPVLAMFCSENRLHQTPVTLRDISDTEYNRMESGPISSWIAGKHSYQVIRRGEYGPGAVSTRVRQVRPAKIWTSQPVDASVKQQLESDIHTWKQELNEVQEKIDADKELLTRLGREHQATDRERIEVEQEKSAKQTALINYKAIPEKINQQESKKKDVERFFERIKTRVIDIRNQQDQISIEKAEAAMDYAKSVEELRQQYEQLVKLEVHHIEALSDLEVLRERNSEYRARLDAKRAELDEASRNSKAASELGRQLLHEARKVTGSIAENHPELKELLPTLANHTMDQLDADIDSEKARLELTQGGNSNVIKEFEERERHIAALRSKLTDFQNSLNGFQEAIDEVRGTWEPKLDSLVQKISDAFSDSFARIGCAGQVSLDKPEDEDGPDFEQWSIQIHVKFRENENLSLLDSHRQSGGERAVSTIFYLMALQSLSASPFRVVDEINQGMDPRNERMVHERLVDIACGDSITGNGGHGGGQYFLITPKLLNGLAYKPGMKVLCIVSGEHMPEDYDLVDFGRVIRRMREIAGKGKGRALEMRGGNAGVGVSA
ncbi:hypothetical protein MAP00_006656 [Monascus purpureus]|nr:hypothetical protein MAP00_006656 [Monascus purpureus]